MLYFIFIVYYWYVDFYLLVGKCINNSIKVKYYVN